MHAKRKMSALEAVSRASGSFLSAHYEDCTLQTGRPGKRERAQPRYITGGVCVWEGGGLHTACERLLDRGNCLFDRRRSSHGSTRSWGSCTATALARRSTRWTAAAIWRVTTGKWNASAQQ